MDIVLEVFDTYIADYCYAKALPASGASFLTQGIKHVASSTFSSLREGATPAPVYSYQPSTSFFTLEPSQYAYQSAWPRDLIYRQALSLYLITW
jgi:Delta7-sterol 5-desaturase